YEPASFSEHLAWSSHDTVFLNDLLPLPYTQARLDVVCDHIDRVQEVLGRRMLLENPSTYVAFASSEM
ncbi:multinuclear nonheme iron-dependent oxidase, partial [Acinetobacter baumannii]